MRRLGYVTLEHCPVTLNQAATVTEACDRMRDDNWEKLSDTCSLLTKRESIAPESNIVFLFISVPLFLLLREIHSH
jgi:hypothetical protein